MSESDVERGRTTTLHNRSGVAHWPFDRLRNARAFDRVGGHTAQVVGAEAAPGVNRTALRFGGDGESLLADVSVHSTFTLSLWVNPRSLHRNDENNYRYLARSDNGPLLILEEGGAITFRTPGINTDGITAGNVPMGRWTHVAATYNGTHRTLFINGTRVASQRVVGSVRWGDEIEIGAMHRSQKAHAFAGRIDDVRIDGTALSADRVRERYQASATNATHG
jgi:hypothetical protein